VDDPAEDVPTQVVGPQQITALPPFIQEGGVNLLKRFPLRGSWGESWKAKSATKIQRSTTMLPIRAILFRLKIRKNSRMFSKDRFVTNTAPAREST